MPGHESSTERADALEAALAALEDGRSVSLDELAAAAPRLSRGELAETLELARDIAVRPAEGMPRVAGYALEFEIGRGGMGTVFLARQERAHGRTVALKVLPHAAGLAQRARERFRAEARTLARLRHPGVVSLIDVVERGDLLAYAMEWIEGSSLDRVMRRVFEGGARPEVERVHDALGPTVERGLLAPAARLDAWSSYVCRIGVRVARALDAVHAAGLIHRDVKPSNILLRRDGVPVLSDFGLVRSDDGLCETRSGAFLGTPAYAAPEQLRGERELDARADVYSLGASLLHALVGALERTASSPNALLARLEREGPPRLDARRHALPRDLETVLRTAMALDPRERYASAGEFAADIERVLRVEAVRAQRPSVVARARTALRRNRQLFGAAVAGGVFAGAAIALVAARLVLVPRWAAADLRAARGALLTAHQAERALDRAYLGAAAPFRPGGRFDFDATLAAYERAARFRDATPLEATEHETIAWMIDWIRSEYRPTLALRALPRHAPLSARMLGSRGAAELAAAMADPDAVPWSEANALDRRCLGLLGFLVGAWDLCAAAWEPLPRRGAEVDPLVDAGLALIFLARGEDGRAYARLRDVRRAVPESRVIALQLTEAALRCGDLDVAEDALSASRALVGEDLFGVTERLEAELATRRGDEVRARAAWARTEAAALSPWPHVARARHLAARGELRAAALASARAARFCPDAPALAQGFARDLAAWWAAAPEAERGALARALARREPWAAQLIDASLACDLDGPFPRALVALASAWGQLAPWVDGERAVGGGFEAPGRGGWTSELAPDAAPQGWRRVGLAARDGRSDADVGPGRALLVRASWAAREGAQSLLLGDAALAQRLTARAGEALVLRLSASADPGVWGGARTLEVWLDDLLVHSERFAGDEARVGAMRWHELALPLHPRRDGAELTLVARSSVSPSLGAGVVLDALRVTVALGPNAASR